MRLKLLITSRQSNLTDAVPFWRPSQLFRHSIDFSSTCEYDFSQIQHSSCFLLNVERVRILWTAIFFFFTSLRSFSCKCPFSTKKSLSNIYQDHRFHFINPQTKTKVKDFLKAMIFTVFHLILLMSPYT